MPEHSSICSAPLLCLALLALWPGYTLGQSSSQGPFGGAALGDFAIGTAGVQKEEGYQNILLFGGEATLEGWWSWLPKTNDPWLSAASDAHHGGGNPLGLYSKVEGLGVIQRAFNDGEEGAFDYRLGLDAEARLELFALGFGYQYGYQKPVKNDDAFWRSRRGLQTHTLTARLHGLYLENEQGALLSVLPAAVSYTFLEQSDDLAHQLIEGETPGLFRVSGDDDRDHEGDLTIDAAAFQVTGQGEESTFQIKILTARLGFFQAIHSQAGEPIVVDGIQAMTFNLSEASFTLIDDFDCEAETGITLLSPTHRVVGDRIFTGMGQPVDLSGEGEDPQTAVSWNLRLRVSSGDFLHHGIPSPHRDTAWSFGVAALGRIDPSGLAADAGGEGAIHIGGEVSPSLRWETEAWGQIFSRRAVSNLVEAFGGADALGIPGKDATLYMGRVELGLRWQLDALLTMRLQTWLEFSDRDDPIQIGGDTPWAPRWSHGANLGLALQL